MLDPVLLRQNPAELAERFEVMAEVEASCGRLAARRISEAELAALRQVHDDCRRLAQAGEVEAYYARNSEFHHCIYRATHNAFLTQEAARLHAMLQPYRRMQLQVRNRMTRSFAEHDAIVAAIRGGDAEAAARRKAAEELAANDAAARPKEFQGPKGPEPTRYGDWETKGIASDF